jgi:hypothetical protein
LFVKGNTDFRVFIGISIPCMTQFDPYENESLVMTLQVEKNGEIEKWLEMKKILICEGGFGVFAVHDFSAREFVTVFLWERFDNTYMFGDILGLSKHFKMNCF